MGYGKRWKVLTSTLEALIDNADGNNYCYLEVWNSSINKIDDSDTELWLEMTSGWEDGELEVPPAVNPML